VGEIYDEPDAVYGMFRLNVFLALVVFYTGASHSSISRVFVDRNKIPTGTIDRPIKISSPEGELVAAFGCRDLTLGIGKYQFPTHLIVLESQGLDVILSMDWMIAFEGVIDCAKRTITLTTPEKKHICFKSTFELKESKVNSLKGVSMEDVPVVKGRFWLSNMKQDIIEYFALCDVCNRVKAEHQKPAGLLQPLPIPEWKWDNAGMDFITGFPRTRSGYDSIWVVVDRLTKVAHFIPVKTTYTSARLAKIYMNRIVCLHGVPKSIVSDRGTQFTSHFWCQLHEPLGTRLEFSPSFHPQTDGQTERVNQILEDMLRACALDYGSSWDENLRYVEFSYNNSHEASIQMAPFEALYGRKCTTPLLWSGVGEQSLFGPDINKDAEEKVRLIRDRLKIAQSRQKSYADSKRREVTYEVGDRAYLRVSPLHGVKRLESKES
jgi:hypothetical protein